MLETDDSAVARLGAITSALEDLNVVEVRDDVSVALVRASSAEQRAATANAIATALAKLDVAPIGVTVDGVTLGVVVERWRQPAVATALRTATFVSG